MREECVYREPSASKNTPIVDVIYICIHKSCSQKVEACCCQRITKYFHLLSLLLLFLLFCAFWLFNKIPECSIKVMKFFLAYNINFIVKDFLVLMNSHFRRFISITNLFPCQLTSSDSYLHP